MNQDGKSGPRLKLSMEALIPSIKDHHAAQRLPQIDKTLMERACMEFVVNNGYEGLISSDALELFDIQENTNEGNEQVLDRIKRNKLEQLLEILKAHETEILDQVRMFQNDSVFLEKYTNVLLQRVLAIEQEKHLPHLPVDEFGPRIAAVARAIADAYKISIDGILTAMMVATAAAAGSKFTYTYGPYTNTPLTIWACMLARSGYGKTGALQEVMRPITRIDERLREQTTQGLFEITQSKEDEPHQLRIDDTTPESRASLLSRNPHGLILFRDELQGMFEDIGRYNSSGEVAKFLEIWSGTSQGQNRKNNNESIYIKRPVMHIFGGTQEESLKKMFLKHNMMDNGFFARWLFVRVKPIFKIEDEETQGVPDEYKREWNDLLESLFDEGTQGRTFILSKEAKDEFRQYVTRLRVESFKLGTTDRERHKCLVLSKLEIYTLKLASIIHLMKEGISADMEIPVETLRTAVRTVETFKYWNYSTIDLIEPPVPIESGEDVRLSEASRADTFKLLFSYYPSVLQNIGTLSDALGVTRQAVYKIFSQAGIKTTKTPKNADN